MLWLTLWGAVVVGCFAAISSAALYGSRQDAGTAAREATKNLSLVVAATIARDVERIDMSMRMIVEGLKRDDVNSLSDELRHLVLFDNIEESQGLGVVVLVDAQGNSVQDSASVQPRHINVSDRDYFIEPQKAGAPEVFVGRPIVSNLSGAWVIPVSRRITLPDGGFGGVVVGTIRVDHLQGIFRKLDLGQYGEVTLWRADGTALARRISGDEAVVGVPERSRLLDLYPAALQGEYTAKSPTDEVSRIYAFHALAPYPLVVTVGMAEDDVYAGWYAKAGIIGLILAMSLVATLVLVAILRRELQRRVAAERAASRNESRYRLLAENSADTIVMSGGDGRVSYASPAIKDLLGWEPADIEGYFIVDFVHPDHHSALASTEADESDARTLTFPARHRNGEWVWLEARVRRLPEGPDGGTSFISNVRDVSRRKKAELALEAVNAQLAAMAATDSLTNLSNRRRFDETLEREWRRCQREGTELALLLIDADHFKSLNDHYGHQQGDVYLKTIARIIQDSIRRPGDMAARVGGEEFAVLLPRTGRDGGLVMAEKIRLSIYNAAIPHNIGPDGVLTVSVGVYACLPTDGMPVLSLFKRADAALYAAKREGRNRSCVYDGQVLAEDEQS